MENELKVYDGSENMCNYCNKVFVSGDVVLRDTLHYQKEMLFCNQYCAMMYTTETRKNVYSVRVFFKAPPTLLLAEGI